MSLINVDKALDFLNLDVKYRDKVETLVEWVQARAESIIRRKLDKADYTLYIDGNGSQNVQVTVIPVNSTTGIYVDSSRVFDTAVDTDNYFISDAGVIHFYNMTVDGVRVVKAVVNAGYDTTDFPADLKMAFYEAISWNLNRVQDKMFGVRNNATPDGMSMQYELVLPMGVQRVFESYRDIM